MKCHKFIKTYCTPNYQNIGNKGRSQPPGSSPLSDFRSQCPCNIRSELICCPEKRALICSRWALNAKIPWYLARLRGIPQVLHLFLGCPWLGVATIDFELPSSLLASPLRVHQFINNNFTLCLPCQILYNSFLSIRDLYAM